MNKKKDGNLADELLNDLLNDADSMSESDRLDVSTDEPIGESSADSSGGSVEDATVRMSHDEIMSGTFEKPKEQAPRPKDDVESTMQQTSANFNKSASVNNDNFSEKVRTSVGRFFSNKAPATPTEASLMQSESLRIAQDRILQLEGMVNELRDENEQLIAAGETLQKRVEKYTSGNEKLNATVREQREYSDDERKILQEALIEKERDIERLMQKNDQAEARLSANMQKIRVRERELENRLELLKMESSALLQNKNEIILDLKKSIDQLNMELDSYRNKGQELNKQLDDKQETLRRTVKTLRLALTMLEGTDLIDKLKKVD